MTQIGMLLKIDPVGRCVIPKPMRELFRIEGNDVLEVLVTDEGILIRKTEYEIRKKQS